MKYWRSLSIFFATLLVALASFAPAFAQSLTGTLRGVVLDSQGKVVPDASVTLTSEVTGVSQTTASSSAGVYTIPDLAAGLYKIQVDAKGFASYVRTHIQVLASQVIEVTVNLEVGGTTTTVVVESGANLVQTESSQISGTFEGNSISDIPIQSGAFLSVLNFSIFLPNTTTQLGGTSGTGGSVGGLRGRENSFSIDGTDNNDPTVTASTQQVIPDAVQELTVNQNIYSAEYGRGAGGQFNVITKTGSNQTHFGAWAYNTNRAYDAADNQEQQLSQKRRYDFNRVGGNIGGPILKDRLFYYGAYEFNNLGLQPSAPSALAPTAAGMTMLNALAADPQVNALLAQFPIAPRQTICPTAANPQQLCTVTITTASTPPGGTDIPVGSVQ